jgi:capsular exopolysaccharide synthesis family protein
MKIIKRLYKKNKKQNTPSRSYIYSEATEKARNEIKRLPVNKKHSTSYQRRMTNIKTSADKKNEFTLIPKKNIDYRSANLSNQKLHNTFPSVSPFEDKKIDKNLISIIKPYSLEANLFKLMRGRILFPISGKPPKSIMITSAAPGEGKSFIASNLAVNLAQNIAEYVLLVDCDLRKPSIHKKFGFGNVKGLSEHISNGHELSDLFLKTVVDKLTILPAGKPPHNPSEILSSTKMADLIDELQSRYDDRYLIFDSPPPLLAPETSAIAKRVDGIIVVIKFGDTSLKIVEQMLDDLGNEKIKGVVINQFDRHMSHYYYDYRKYRKYYC